MSLSLLVEFAQEHFAAPSRAPDERDDTEVQSLADRFHRPPLPHWIGETSERDLPLDSDHPWRIEGPIDPQQPPPEVDKFGADALAFWVPFHFYRERWGIYVRLSGVLYFASVLKGGGLQPGDERYLDIAEAFLVEHERVHAEMEIACTRAELVARTPLYQPYFADPTASEHEEALSNAQALLWRLDQIEFRVRDRAQSWMQQQGPGYRDFFKWLSSRKLSRGRDRAARFMLNPLPRPHPKESGPSRTFLFHEVRRYVLPTNRINDLPASHVSVLRPFPKQFGLQVLVHSNDHPPPHVHIQMDGFETRYIWPDLTPMKNDPSLPARGQKSLGLYLEAHGTRIAKRLRQVYGEVLHDTS